MAKGVAVGLKDLCYSLLSNDPTTGVATYEAPVKIPGAISANINPNSSNATLFADDGPYETTSTIGEISLEMNVADLPLEVQAVIFGHTLSGGILIRKAGDTPPWLAVGFRSLKSNGSYRYTWLAKGKFALHEQNNATRGDSIEFQTPTASGSFVKRDCDDEWERHIDEDYVNYMPVQGTQWFNGPYGGPVDTVAPTITSVVPAANATAVVVTAPVVWTFNEPLALTTLTKEHFAIVKDTDGSNVAGTLTVNAARTVVTFTPSTSMTAATAYRAIVTSGVKDLAGNPLAAPSVTKFTTA